MLTTLWLVSLSFFTVCTPKLIVCPYKSVCQYALLSGNDIVLQCNYRNAFWYFTSYLGEDLFLFNTMPNGKVLPGGSLQLRDPQPSQSGLYRCQTKVRTRIVEYEVDFQDVTTLHTTHKDLEQKPLENQTLNLGGKVLVFTQWEPWQNCNRCGKRGERKRLGYCYVEEPLERPMPCWLYLREEKVSYSRLRPELQLQTCRVSCDSSKEIYQPYFIFDIYQQSRWLSCPLASIYR